MKARYARLDPDNPTRVLCGRNLFGDRWCTGEFGTLAFLDQTGGLDPPPPDRDADPREMELDHDEYARSLGFDPEGADSASSAGKSDDRSAPTPEPLFFDGFMLYLCLGSGWIKEHDTWHMTVDGLKSRLKGEELQFRRPRFSATAFDGPDGHPVAGWVQATTDLNEFPERLLCPKCRSLNIFDPNRIPIQWPSRAE